MGTRLVIKDRGKGKTTGLLYTSEATGYPIIVETENRVRQLIEQAEDLGVNIPHPMTVKNFRQHHCKSERVLIDEGYNLIGLALDSYMGCHVVCATLSDNIKESSKLQQTIMKG